jgi:hypothetical protein
MPIPPLLPTDSPQLTTSATLPTAAGSVAAVPSVWPARWPIAERLPAWDLLPTGEAPVLRSSERTP